MSTIPKFKGATQSIRIPKLQTSSVATPAAQSTRVPFQLTTESKSVFAISQITLTCASHVTHITTAEMQPLNQARKLEDATGAKTGLTLALIKNAIHVAD